LGLAFANNELDIERRELRRDGRTIVLPPQIFDLLVYLVRNRDRVVSKDDLLAAVWGGRAVSDSAMTTAINAVRKAVGDNGNAQAVIRTLHRKGIRFVGTIEGTDNLVPAASALPTRLALPDKPSIAVLPFSNMSSDPEQEFFADGIAEDITTALSRYPSLFVIARNSSFTYKGQPVDVKQVGRDLGVRYVLEGSIRKAGSRIRVTGQLAEAETANHVWAERYDRELIDIFDVQDEIAAAVTMAIAPAIADAERQRASRKSPESLDAWTAYQRGLWHLSRLTAAETAAAERFFQQAIDLDPNFAGGYIGLAQALNHAATTFQTRDFRETQAELERLAHRAVALSDADAEAHSSLSWALLARRDYPGALAEAERALALNPNLARAHGTLGQTLIFMGRPADGLPHIETCIRLDPRDPAITIRSTQIAMGLYFARDYSRAVEAAERVLRSHPEFPQALRWLAAALGQLGRVEAAKTAILKALSAAPGSFGMYVTHPAPWWRREDHEHMLDGLRKAGWEG
jgi:adenylate cyclase